MQGLNGRKRIATYERTSSEDQRERATIKTQTEEIARHLQLSRLSIWSSATRMTASRARSQWPTGQPGGA